jgi:pyruvate,water dikinase
MNVKNFSELSKDSVSEAGGKGASLGEMTGAGIPVPPGCVVLASAFDDFLETMELDLKIEQIFDGLDAKNTASVEKASEDIRSKILGNEFPEDLKEEILAHFKALETEYVAVRSSATAEDGSENSWAGELESYLNTTEENLLENIKNCWSSLFTSRAIFYRNEKGLLKSKVSVAVVVQKMVQSEVAGVAFTTHPVTEDPNQMIIEAGWGLGEMVVSGQVTPDSYVVNKSQKTLDEVAVNEQGEMMVRDQEGSKKIPVPAEQKEKQKLSPEQILELAEICLKVEKHYGFPCDIEWGFEANKFYIVQSRPITTLSAK